MTPQKDGSLCVNLRAEPRNEILTAYRPEVARAKGLPEPANYLTHTKVRNPDEVFRYSFPDVEGKIKANNADFLSMPAEPLPFPSILAVSENDPCLPLDLAARLSRAWRSEIVNAGRRGHIDIASRHGPWIEGEHLLEDLISKADELEEYDAVAKK